MYKPLKIQYCRRCEVAMEPSEDIPHCGTYYRCPECLDIAYFSTREQIKRTLRAPSRHDLAGKEKGDD